ncbi:hypothetical protein BJF78_29590 [Pseudonocardia sp. CNS-139]|nr:hypothetical protein BJF78_29590 [Pseudonocardia sp. CNS-139]
MLRRGDAGRSAIVGHGGFGGAGIHRRLRLPDTEVRVLPQLTPDRSTRTPRHAVVGAGRRDYGPRR